MGPCSRERDALALSASGSEPATALSHHKGVWGARARLAGVLLVSLAYGNCSAVVSGVSQPSMEGQLAVGDVVRSGILLSLRIMVVEPPMKAKHFRAFRRENAESWRGPALNSVRGANIRGAGVVAPATEVVQQMWRRRRL